MMIGFSARRLIVSYSRKGVQGEGLRGYIFTEYERRLLKEWLEKGSESQVTLDMFWRMRRCTHRLRQNLELMLR
jgi:hypothetical protein